MTLPRFYWSTFDVRSMLPRGWSSDILTVARSNAKRKILIPIHSTSREARADLELPTQTVGGADVAQHLPWLRKFYIDTFRDLAQRTTEEPVVTMSDIRFGAVLNIQTGQDRYECHVDTNPIEGLLYVTTHREGEGGELVVSNRGQVHSVEEVEDDATIVEPKAGYLLFFDGRSHSHYVRQLKDPNSIRVAVAMNYYIPSCPESTRPADLNTHLSGYK